MRVELEGKTFEFRPDKQGVARDGEGAFRVKNANDAGVVHGGLMEFEVTLPESRGADAAAPAAIAGDTRSGGGPTLAIEVARAHHRARLPLPSGVTEKAMGEKRIVGAETPAR